MSQATVEQAVRGAVKKLGFYSSSAEERFVASVLQLPNIYRIDEQLFQKWTEELDLSTARNKAAYFRSSLEFALQSGSLIAISSITSASKPVVVVESDEEVDANTRSWIQECFELTGGYPSKEARYFDRSGVCRGHFDGKGGFVHVKSDR